jgi:hypothetical protein
VRISPLFKGTPRAVPDSNLVDFPGVVETKKEHLSSGYLRSLIGNIPLSGIPYLLRVVLEGFL